MPEPFIPVYRNKPDSQSWNWHGGNDPYLPIWKNKPDNQVYKSPVNIPVWQNKPDGQVYTWKR